MTARSSTPAERSRRSTTSQSAKSRAATTARSRWLRRQVSLASAVLILLLIAVGYKAYGVQVTDADHFRTMARQQHLRTLRIPAPRGVLHDRRGRELAVTVDVDSIYASPRTVKDVTGTAEALALALDLDVRALEAKLASRRHFVWIARHVTPERAATIRDLELPGVAITTEPRRFYPGQSIAGTVLGFANIDGKGIEGVERTMDELLQGRQGEMPALRDARGRLMQAEAGLDPGDMPGAKITLTIDRSIQFIAERVLEETVTEHKAAAGTAIILDVKSGQVLAMANWPTYDPNRPGAAGRRGARNRGITDAYEIGSSIKIFSVAAALEAGVVRPNQIIDVEHGRFRVGRKLITDSHHDWELDVTGVIKRSSNVGAAKIARKLGASRLHDAFVRYGLGAKTGIELPGERSGILRPAKRWGEIGLATASFGYGLTVTPLQTVAGYAAVANGGIYNQPRVVKEARGVDGELLYAPAPAPRRMMRADVAKQMLAMMGAVFEKGRRHGGTARNVRVPGYHPAGKTGTAHKVDPATGRYGKHLYLSSFVGVAPIEQPRVAAILVIDEPHGKEHYGAKVAGPGWGRMVSETLRYLDVPIQEDPEALADPKAEAKRLATKAKVQAGTSASAREEQAEDLPDDVPVEVLTQAIDGVPVPDFSGMGIAEVLERAEEFGVSVDVVGTGRVARQIPAAGVPTPDGRCQVVFEPGYR